MNMWVDPFHLNAITAQACEAESKLDDPGTAFVAIRGSSYKHLTPTE